MTSKMMMCSNCGNYHCCNFRPISSSSTANQKMLSTRATLKATPINPKESISQYQLARPITPITQKISSRAPSPKRVHFQRPVSNTSTQSLNEKHYLYKKQEERALKAVAKQQPILKRRASPHRVLNRSRQSPRVSPQRIVQGYPVIQPARPRITQRVGTSPSRINSIRSNSPPRVLQHSISNKHTRVSNLQKTMSNQINPISHPIIRSQVNHNSHNNINNQISHIPSVIISSPLSNSTIQHSPRQISQQVLRSSVIPVNVSVSPRSSSTVFPNPSNVIVSQAISKIQNSKVSSALKSSHVSEYAESGYAKNSNVNSVQNSRSKNYDCSYNDNRCLGFDFAGNQKYQLKLDQTGHLKDSLHN